MDNELTYRMEGPVQIAVDQFNRISAPNKYIGQVTRYHNIFSGKNVYTTFKNIEGKVVYTGNAEYAYGLFQGGNPIGTESPSIIGSSYDEEDLKQQRYNELGQREMIFYYPFINYKQYKNDLTLLNDLGSDKYLEMALSFDNFYSMEEVKRMIPEGVNISWYWIDDLNDQEKENSKPRPVEHEKPDGSKEIVYPPAKIRSERTAYGIKAYNPNGVLLADPVESFIHALQSGRKYDTRYKWEFERVFNNIAGKDAKITKDEIKVQGFNRILCLGELCQQLERRLLFFVFPDIHKYIAAPAVFGQKHRLSNLEWASRLSRIVVLYSSNALKTIFRNKNISGLKFRRTFNQQNHPQITFGIQGKIRLL